MQHKEGGPGTNNGDIYSGSNRRNDAGKWQIDVSYPQEIEGVTSLKYVNGEPAQSSGFLTGRGFTILRNQMGSIIGAGDAQLPINTASAPPEFPRAPLPTSAPTTTTG